MNNIPGSFLMMVLVSDFELERRFYGTDILDDLLDERRYFQFIINEPTLTNK